MKIFDILIVWVEDEGMWIAQKSYFSKFLEFLHTLTILRIFDFGIKVQMNTTDKILAKKVLRNISDREPELFGSAVSVLITKFS